MRSAESVDVRSWRAVPVGGEVKHFVNVTMGDLDGSAQEMQVSDGWEVKGGSLSPFKSTPPMQLSLSLQPFSTSGLGSSRNTMLFDYCEYGENWA